MKTNKLWSLISSEEVKNILPLTNKQKGVVTEWRKSIIDIIQWKSNKKLLIIGPCSLDYDESVLRYVDEVLLHNDVVKTQDKIQIVMRAYTQKPRTITWWRGIQDSQPWEKTDINKWLLHARELSLKIIDRWIPIADELLSPQYIFHMDDYLSYWAIWARASENTFHRDVASFVGFPVWIKNPTSWDIWIMTNNIRASQVWWWVFSINWELYKWSGNEFAHWILRWWWIWPDYKSPQPNYSYDHIQEYLKFAEKLQLENPWLIVDCNHWNSWKQYEKQINIMEDLFDNVIPKLWEQGNVIKWFMVESYLYDGRQDYVEWTKKWLSITDPCIGKERTIKFILKLAENLK